MTNPPRATITDVARAAGVAVGTVSRVFNHHPDVNDEIRERVLAAARQLGYSRLRQRKRPRERAGAAPRGNIGVICFGMEDTLVQLPVVSAALQGIENALSLEGRSLMLANIPRGDRVPHFLAEKEVEGLIVKGPNQGDLPPAAENDLIRAIQRVPHVWLMGRLPSARGDHCNFDTSIAGQLAADHLAARGHRRVAFFNPKPGQTQFERVKRDFLAACALRGLEASLLETPAPAQRAWPLPAITQPENVDLLLEQWQGLAPKARPTALFIPSDRTTAQLYAALERRGLRAARDVSVISCNNEKAILASLHPAVTTIDVHAEAIGRRAVDQLLWRIAHRDDPHTMQVLVEPSLVERHSVAPL